MISSFVDLFEFLLSGVLQFTDILYFFFGFLTVALLASVISYLVRGKY